MRLIMKGGLYSRAAFTVLVAAPREVKSRNHNDTRKEIRGFYYCQ